MIATKKRDRNHTPTVYAFGRRLSHLSGNSPALRALGGIPGVYRLARKFLARTGINRKHPDQDDLVSFLAVIGVDTLNREDPPPGKASSLLWGSFRNSRKDYSRLHAMTGMFRYSRTDRKRYEEQPQEPTDPVERMEWKGPVRFAVLFPLDTLVDYEGEDPLLIPETDSRPDEYELREYVEFMIATLPTAMKRVIMRLRYLPAPGKAPMTLKDIGLRVGVTESRVTQLVEWCIDDLRWKFGLREGERDVAFSPSPVHAHG